MYDDVLLIQLLYSLALRLEDLSILKHEGVDKKGFLNYVHFKRGAYRKIYIDDRIALFILNYINYKGPGNPYFNKTTRKRKGYKLSMALLLFIEIAIIYAKDFSLDLKDE